MMMMIMTMRMTMTMMMMTMMMTMMTMMMMMSLVPPAVRRRAALSPHCTTASSKFSLILPT